MRNFLIRPALVTLVALLAACGGSGGPSFYSSSGSSGSGSTSTTPTVATLQLTTSAPQIPSAGSSSATITALALDSNNNALSGVTITFSASSGALSSVQGTTSSSGAATAVLSTGNTPEDGTITVTATSGSAKTTVTVEVTGTTLSVSGPTSLVQGAQATYSVTLTDSGGNPIAGQVVTLKSSSSNTLPGTVTTGSNGQATFSYTATNSGTDTITATTPYASAAATQSVSISSQNFIITAPTAGATIDIYPQNSTQVPTSPPTGYTTQTVSINWQNSGVAVTSGTVQFSTSRGTFIGSSSVAVANGTASATLYSTTAGPATVTATALDSSSNTVASAQVVVNFVAPPTGFDSISVQANPAVVPVQGQSTVVATVTDGANATGNPVQGATVDFTLTDSTGGTLSGGGSAVTNAQGQATVTYTASTGSSTPDGVKIAADIANYPSITSGTTLTVGGQTVFLSLGTGNTISAYSSTQYEMPFTVQAVDAAGNGLSGVTVTFTLQSVAYAEGLYSNASGSWVQEITAGGTLSTPSGGSPTCPAPTAVTETNGVITASGGTTIIPGNVASTDVSSATTNSTGTASVNIIYPKSDALWVAVALTASATVQGSQNSTTSVFWLPVLASDLATATVSPPNQFSPFGDKATCW